MTEGGGGGGGGSNNVVHRPTSTTIIYYIHLTAHSTGGQLFLEESLNPDWVN